MSAHEFEDGRPPEIHPHRVAGGRVVYARRARARQTRASPDNLLTAWRPSTPAWKRGWKGWAGEPSAQARLRD